MKEEIKRKLFSVGLQVVWLFIVIVVIYVAITYCDSVNNKYNNLAEMYNEEIKLKADYQYANDEGTVAYWKNKYNEAAALYNATWDEMNAYREIAERTSMSSFIDIDIPEMESDAIGYIYIPTCNIQGFIRYGSTAEAISNFHVGEFEDSEDIGIGNYSLCGHANELKKYVFSPLYDIEIGDPIYIYKDNTIYKFSADYIRTVEPEETWILNHTDTPTCTLMCCVDEGKNRFVVFGNLLMSKEVLSSE